MLPSRIAWPTMTRRNSRLCTATLVLIVACRIVSDNTSIDSYGRMNRFSPGRRRFRRYRHRSRRCYLTRRIRSEIFDKHALHDREHSNRDSLWFIVGNLPGRRARVIFNEGRRNLSRISGRIVEQIQIRTFAVDRNEILARLRIRDDRNLIVVGVDSRRIYFHYKLQHTFVVKPIYIHKYYTRLLVANSNGSRFSFYCPCRE